MAFKTELEVALRAVREAALHARKYAPSSVSVETKSDHSPVTELDRKLDDLLYQSIQKRFPDDDFFTEERGYQGSGKASRVWYIDPLDGTKEFIQGNSEWAIQVGLIENQRPVLGIVAQPLTETFFYATLGGKAWKEDKTISRTQILCHSPSLLSEACLVDSRSRNDPKVEDFVKAAGIRKKKNMGSIGLKICNIASGESDLYLNFSGLCGPWDTCGPECILSEAGGALLTLEGKEIQYSRDLKKISFPFFASSQTLTSQVSRLLKGTS